MFATQGLRLYRSLRQRASIRELIDDDVDDKRLLAESFDDIERVNRYFGGITPVRDAVLRRHPQTVLDVGCGIADLSRAIVTVARTTQPNIRVTCLDANETILGIAQEKATRFPEMSFVQGWGENLPFADKSFDVAICTLTLHHCEPTQAIGLLRELQRVAYHPIVGDLRRGFPGLLGAFLFSRLLSRNALTRHDAPASVRRSYTLAEARNLAEAAGWSAPKTVKTPFFRMLVTNDC